jgi:hypothetical protein
MRPAYIRQPQKGSTIMKRSHEWELIALLPKPVQKPV